MFILKKGHQPGVYVPLRALFLVFLIFALKHRLWVLIRTASLRRFQRVPKIYVLSKNKKNIKKNHRKISIFTAVKNRCLLHGRVFVMKYMPVSGTNSS